jgi:hypothetical protein
VVVYPRVDEDRSIWAAGVPLLGRVPLEAQHGQNGWEPAVVHAPESRRGAALRAVAEAIRQAADGGGAASTRPEGED